MIFLKEKNQALGEKLSLRETVSYGLGDLACSMVFNFMASYLLYFYTDVAGVGVAAAGTAMSAARLIDAFANPVVGVLSDKTHTKCGKLRPYLLFSAIPLAISVLLMFLCSWVPGPGKGIFALLTYTFFCLMYTVCNVPYTAMMPNLSEDPAQRARLNLSKFVCISAGTFLSMGLALPLIDLFGRGDERRGFVGISLLFSAIIIVLVLVCFFNTRERVQPPPVAFSLGILGETVKKSRPAVICCCAQLFFYLVSCHCHPQFHRPLLREILPGRRFLCEPPAGGRLFHHLCRLFPGAGCHSPDEKAHLYPLWLWPVRGGKPAGVPGRGEPRRCVPVQYPGKPGGQHVQRRFLPHPGGGHRPL